MAAIYIHIPFCRQKCSYCDFFSTEQSIPDRIEKSDMNALLAGNGKEEKYIDTICEEIIARNDYLHEPVETVYFGGGTPSLLSSSDFEKIFQTLHLIYGENRSREITLEANPDDMTSAYVGSIKRLPFNRVSLGVQSFDNNELRLLNRRHDAQTAIRAVELLKQAGYDNISIDLIYGLPYQTTKTWTKTLQQTIDLQIQHVSAYHLSYEEGTPMYQRTKAGSLIPVDEDMSSRLFEILIDTLQASGFEHYEISNFALPGFQSRHNSSYWNGMHYLGIGASAHSYNGFSRQWNKNSVEPDYRKRGYEIETIDEKTAYNDFVMTRLRTMKGMNLNELTELFGETKKLSCLKQAQKYITSGRLQLEDNYLRLTRKGVFISDGIICDLMG